MHTSFFFLLRNLECALDNIIIIFLFFYFLFYKIKKLNAKKKYIRTHINKKEHEQEESKC